MKNLRPVLHIEDPAEQSIHLAETVSVRAWVLSDAECRAEEIASRLRLIAECQPAEKNRAVVEALSVRKSAPAEWIWSSSELEQALARRPAGAIFSVTANLRILQDEDAAALLRLQLFYCTGTDVVCSTAVCCVLAERGQWDYPRGGFIFPASPAVAADFLVIEGWAVRKGDPITRVELSIDDRPITGPQFGFWSPLIKRDLPSVSQAQNCRFSAVVSRRQMPGEVLGSKAAPRALRLYANVVFASGRTYSFPSGGFQWLSGQEGELSGDVVKGEIEQVSLHDSGQILVQGWAVSRALKPPGLYLEGLHRLVRLGVAPAPPVIWSDYRPVIQRYLSSASGAGARFQVLVNPFCLRRFPGPVRLLAQTDGGGKFYPLGPSSAWREMRGKIRLFAAPSSVKERVIDRAGDLLGSIRLQRLRLRGLTDGLAVNREVEPQLLVASHNLSAVEGAPKVLFALVRHIVQQKLPAPALRVVSSVAGPLADSYSALGVSVLIEPKLNIVGQSWCRYYDGLRALRGKLADFRPRCCLANVIDAFWGVEYAHRLSARAGWIIHESISPDHALCELEPALRAQFLMRLNRAERLIFVAKQTRDLYLHYTNPRRTEVIPNGIDTEEIDRQCRNLSRESARRAIGAEADETVISIIGTTTARKGQDLFIREMAELKRKAPEKKFRFFVVGAREGPFLAELERLKEECRLQRELHFISENPQIGQFFIASDILVIASREEASPLVSLEAFAYRRPLISTRVFGLADQIIDGENALAFNAEVPGALADAALRLITDSDLAQRLTTRARLDVERRFSLNASLECYWQIITQLLGAK